jgi:hypothetical protein
MMEQNRQQEEQETKKEQCWQQWTLGQQEQQEIA